LALEVRSTQLSWVSWTVTIVVLPVDSFLLRYLIFLVGSHCFSHCSSKRRVVSFCRLPSAANTSASSSRAFDQWWTWSDLIA
jgi:hypothetical protein